MVLSGVDLTNFKVNNEDAEETIIPTIATGIKKVGLKLENETSVYDYEYPVKYIFATGNTSPGFRAILKFERSKL